MSKELNNGIPKAIVIGKSDFSDDDKAKHDKEFELMLKQFGVLSEDQSIEDMNKPKF